MNTSEAHGILTAILCVDTQADCQFWLSLVFDDNRDALGLNDEDRACLQAVYDETLRLLTETDFAFDLLQPESDSVLSERAEALAHWCKGFVYGLGATQATQSDSELYTEVLTDLNAIAQLDPDADGENAEADLTELSEYVRVAVQNIWFELRNHSDTSVTDTHPIAH